MPNSSGWVFDIQRFSVHDGPGIRTTVFLKGCGLRCPWCHNPEGLEPLPQLRLTRSLCTLCARCVAACSHGCHAVTPDGHDLDFAECTRCGDCVAACQTGALEMVGERKTLDEVMAVVARDEPFYRNSGGGMTLSGGEPLAQFEFTRALLEAARSQAYHTAIETTAMAPWGQLEQLRGLTDLFLVDIKHTDPQCHRALTGVSNELILANIRRMLQEGWPLVLRVPWVPRLNAEETFLEGLVELLSSVTAPPLVEFMPYHRLGLGKWESLGKRSPMPDDIPDADPDAIAAWVARLNSAGLRAQIS